MLIRKYKVRYIKSSQNHDVFFEKSKFNLPSNPYPNLTKKEKKIYFSEGRKFNQGCEMSEKFIVLHDKMQKHDNWIASHHYIKLTLDEILELRKHLLFISEEINFNIRKKRIIINIIDKNISELNVWDGRTYLKEVDLNELYKLLKANFYIFSDETLVANGFILIDE